MRGNICKHCQWELEYASGFSSPGTMWPCGNVEGGDKENANCAYTMATAKRKQLIWYRQ